MSAPDRIWVEHHGFDGRLGNGDGEVYLSPPKSEDVPITEFVRADILEHWRHEVGKLHSQLDRLTSELAAAVAATQAMTAENARLVARDAEAREIVSLLLSEGASLTDMQGYRDEASAWLSTTDKAAP